MNAVRLQITYHESGPHQIERTDRVSSLSEKKQKSSHLSQHTSVPSTAEIRLLWTISICLPLMGHASWYCQGYCCHWKYYSKVE